MANSGKINLYKLKYRIVYCSGNNNFYLPFIRRGSRVSSDWAIRQFTLE